MERWRDVVGYEELYEVSDHGRVRSVSREGRRYAGCILSMPLKTERGRKTYPRVNLSNRGTRRTRTVHKLVAEAFLGPCPEGREVDHCDGDKTNNRPSNLEYVTHAENRGRAKKLGLCRGGCLRGEDSGTARLTEAQVRRIRALYDRGRTQKSIAQRFGMSQPHIHAIVHRRAWAHVR